MTRRPRHLWIALLAVGAAGSVASATPRATYQWTDPALSGASWETPTAAVVSNIIYLNNCAGGCQLSPGQNNATTNRSSIINSAVNIPAYTGSATQWNQIVACVRQTYAPFNVQIVTDRPPAGTNYHMAIVAGRAANAGQQNGVLGVSPFSCGYIPNAISFTFANEAPNSILDLCWTVAQETAHSWGLDHKYDNRDPMTYLSSGPAQKAFQNAAGSCGEYSSRQCSCNYAQTGSQAMNSYALIMATFGANMPDTTPPAVAVTSPSANAQVTPGFGVTATISDNVAVTKAELRLDGVLVGMKTSAPWTWTTPATLTEGSHRVQVTAFDAANNMASAFVDVAYGAPDPDMPGDMPGDPGTECATGADCVSGQCVIDSDGVGTCDGGDDGDGGADDGAGPDDNGNSDGGTDAGCSSSSSSPSSLLAGLVCVALFARRRRRSAYIR
jgi:MYXO-CTERM domain-containing protein